MANREGWRGRFFEDFEVGDVYEHPSGRTVTTTDNMWFTLLTQNTAPIHVDHAYAAKTEFGRPLVDSTFTVALVTGQSVTDVSQNVFANLGWDEVRLPAPVFEGDTIYSKSEVLEKRGSRSRPGVGIVRLRPRATTRRARRSSPSCEPSWSTGGTTRLEFPVPSPRSRRRERVLPQSRRGCVRRGARRLPTPEA